MISCIIPMYNEEENVNTTIERIDTVLSSNYTDFEIIPVNDGSKDRTEAKIYAIKKTYPKVNPVSYEHNRGEGGAIKAGIKASKGDIIITIDADLSYSPELIPALVDALDDNHIAISSPYMKGGKTVGVPFSRLLVSKVGNRILGLAIAGGLHTTTSVFRAYRREVLEALEIETDGKDINPEILAKASAMGYKIKEVPATLNARKEGKSKFKMGSAINKHLWFSLYQKPLMLFGFIGLIILSIGLVIGAYLLSIYLTATLNPERPLVNLAILCIISGTLVLLFGFISNQLIQMRKEVYILQRDVRKLLKDRKE